MRRFILCTLIIVPLLFILSACNISNGLNDNDDSTLQIDFVTLSQAKTGPVGQIYKVKGVVIAISNDMFLIQDDSDTMVVYTGLEYFRDLAIGDEVEVQGLTKEYRGTIEFGAEEIIYKKVGTKPVIYPQARVLNGNDLCDLCESAPKTQFIQISGTLLDNYGYYNLDVGTIVKGELRTTIDLSKYVNKHITIRGYYLFMLTSTAEDFAFIIVTDVCLDDINYEIINSEIVITGINYTTDKLVIPSIIDGMAVKYIGGSAFSGCESLTSITIPDSVTSIGDYAFKHCSSLTSITIPGSVEFIGREAFFYCTSLTSITIPDSVTSIGQFAFHGCTSLTSIVVDKNNEVYDSRDNCNAIIEKEFSTLIFGCSTTIIPNSVGDIGDNAFNNCTSLTSITIPDSVTSIGENAFGYCKSLTIKCKAISKPNGWDPSWNSSNCPVVWGYTGN